MVVRGLLRGRGGLLFNAPLDNGFFFWRVKKSVPKITTAIRKRAHIYHKGIFPAFWRSCYKQIVPKKSP
ncbi:hypothetical protein HMPREF0519_1970 [Lentilactobacillus hilgardii DSM 20176 = ATCC 8290]|uniref:Uncharacterized protein n=1 Tax=Lentilactobacillus hilgardii (strain ATCC 8290 / DSM 20176 / CCUG 30140 / JCM 1155 / KCTC 3500 / NBRC 15886 / NCIMB 8040 / NRRL B-1843 / 9) TaxID=1423757 RepID=C0XL59_LENH9|nr:hypothetical protein HMPREF0519_1970 [Lentilactobacillus hilgardii DSM 20176 = ATCC 8290]